MPNKVTDTQQNMQTENYKKPYTRC